MSTAAPTAGEPAGSGTAAALRLTIEGVPGVGPRRAAALREAGIVTLGDLLYHLPRRYLDRSRLVAIAAAPPGAEVTLVGQVARAELVAGRRPRFLLHLQDDSGKVVCTWFHGARYLEGAFEPGDQVAVSGRITQFRGQRQLVHPEYEFVAAADDGAGLHTGRIIPLYATSADMKERGLRSRGFRRLMWAALELCIPQLEDPLPPDTRRRLQLADLGESLRQVHFPAGPEQAAQARRRLAFDELFALQVRLLAARRRRLRGQRGVGFARSQRLVPVLLERLPYTLTAAQQRVVDEIAADMGQPCPMRRLLQGDVGSGKTVVAACAILTAVEAGYQAALMAPTEILADQHYRGLSALMEPLGVGVVLLAGGQSAPLRREGLAQLADGAVGVAVGTHALIQDEVRFGRLGLVVIDEQHRFGVEQRARLYGKGDQVDALYMTATPIPRSLALTLYGDVELSVIDELPPGRQPVRTAIRRPERRAAVLRFARDQMALGQQVYVVFPVIEASERADLASATAAYEQLRAGAFCGYSTGLLHGRLGSADKTAAIAAFAAGHLQALVTTTVIEVGVDVPRATVMIVEHAERFGLAQLHQLRGRVGRGGAQSYCILMDCQAAAGADLPARQRLETMCRTQDGFEIADADLRLRGPGEFFGTRQTGMPPLRVADLARDEQLLRLARFEADGWLTRRVPPSAAPAAATARD